MPNSTIDELPPLSDEDVAILYNIVTSAETSRDPPFRALFAAYDTVLAENGIESAHDQVYFRFLLRMGEVKAKGEIEDLFGTFEATLGKLGIQIEVDRDADNIEEITRRIDDLYENPKRQDTHPSQGAAAKKSSRRASFSSMHDINGDTTRRDGDGGPERPQRSQSQASIRVVSGSRPQSRASASGIPAQRRRKSHQQLPTGRAARSRLTGPEVNGNTGDHRQRNRSTSSKRGYPVWRYPMLVDERGLHNLSSGSDDNTFNLSQSFDEAHQEGDEDPVHYVPQHVLYRPSLTQMDFDAETFLYHRTSSHTQRILRDWCHNALQLRSIRASMDEAAQSHDWNTLVRQALEQWRVALNAKRQAAETERFFEQLDRRASKARDLFLLTKAFTHWAQSASDQVLRTSVARRHILRTKYFNAWRDITAVNALKVRRQRLKKFYSIWKGRAQAVITETAMAVDVYRGNLAKKVYWRWFWGFCERRAPLWGAERIRRKYLGVLVEKVQHRAQVEAWASEIWTHNTKRSVLMRWTGRLGDFLRKSKGAEAWRRKKMLRDAFALAEVQARLAPLARQISSKVDLELAHGLITLWNERAKLSCQASDVNQIRVMRNAWTAWNDQLRVQALAARIDDRVVLQALYRWVVAARFSLLQRVLQGKLKREVLARWAARTNKVRGSLEQAELRLVASRNRRRIRSVFIQWRVKTQGHLQQDHLAFDVYSHQVAHRTFQNLSTRLEHVQQLNKWAKDARFYILATNTLKKWQAALAQNKRMKRREAYVTIRVRVKRSMAQRVLAIWRDKTSHIVGMARQAEQVYQNRLMMLGTQLFDNWRIRTLNVLEQLRQADDIFTDHVLRQQLHRWIQAYRLQQRLDDQARNLNAENINSVAAGLLRKLNWRVFQVKRLDETAASLWERNERKHQRNMIRYWAEKATLKREGARPRAHDTGIQTLRLPPISLSPDRHQSQRQMLLDEGDEDAALRAESWTAFDEDFGIAVDQVGLGTTPLPGYLRTPSRRTARAKARFALMSTTPATAPPITASLGITPFERKLKAQYPDSARAGGGGGGGRRSGVGLGHNTRGRVFDDIAETSPVVGDS